VTRVAERVVIDTNVLLAATDEGRREHARCVAALDSWPAAGTTLYTSGQILREYLVVATRPAEQNGLGLSPSDALTNSATLRKRLQMLDEDRRVADRLADLLSTVECAGKQIHDANMVATALVHGIGAIATLNTDDFDRFRAVISIVDVLGA
jgi:predicted nucleic acid-binding protein